MPQPRYIAIQLTGFIFFSFFIFLSVLYYKERMLSFDPAFFSFCMIQNNGFNIALGRWSNVITELLPWMGLKAGCSLKTFLLLFSIAPSIIHYLIFLFITFVLKNYKAALALLLGMCLTFRLTFYYNTTELSQAIAFTFLVWALVNDVASPARWRMGLCMLLIIVISYFHQLAVFTVVFALLFEWIIREKQARRPIAMLLVFSLLW